MNIRVGKFDLNNVKSETLVVGLFSGGKYGELINSLDRLTDGSLKRFLNKNLKFGKFLETSHFHISSKNHKNIEKLILIGMGEEKKLDNERLRNLGGVIGKQNAEVPSIAVYLPKETKLEDRVESLILGIDSGTFDPGHRKTEKVKNEKGKVESMEILTDGDLKKVADGVKLGQIIAQSVHKVREVVNLPANDATPEFMVSFAKKIAKDNNLQITVFSEQEVNKMGMGSMASVAKGSEEDLYFTILKYNGGGPKAKTLALVGKGITFDSGGISIKPSESMEWMKMDMAGAAAVLGAIEVIAKLKPKINVIAATPLTENLPSGKATKPGDIVKSYSGKTIEIINTDAEGRLVLADALTYVQKDLKADYIVDVATLTGASLIALGNFVTAIMGKPQEFVNQVMNAAENAGERMWQLPLFDEYREQLKSYIADIQNVGGRPAGTETAGKFLEEFVKEDSNWVHLDIAPTAWVESEKPYLAKGATGVPLATLVNLALNLAQSKK
ncbi:MAG TPA: leucyl aminopeptidase [Patescibacteria group bacterium]